MRKISKNQFDLYMFFTREWWVELINEEIAWYMNEAKTLWAVICLDRIDNNYNVIFCARDNNRHIRCIDLETDIESFKLAHEYVYSHARLLESQIKPLNNPKNKIPADLFIPISKKSKLNPYFQIISQSPAHSAARNVINEILPYFFDVDGNFVQQFQTTGFDARLWELYLFCYFTEEQLEISRKYFAPDFLLAQGEMEVSVEAVIVSNKNSYDIHRPFPQMEDIMQEEKIMPSKWGSSLYSKLTHVDCRGIHYWEYQHTKGKPFVIAIADFHDAFSMTWSQASLITYLYGFEYKHAFDSSGNLIVHPIKVSTHPKGPGLNTIPSGFFFQESSENISAVLHSSCATISKFNRIGKQCDLDENNVLMYRIVSVHDFAPNSVTPKILEYQVTECNSEPWAEGVTVFHNPNAKYPLPRDFFPNAAQCYLQDNLIHVYSINPIVYSSMTYNFLEPSKLEDFKQELHKYHPVVK